MANSKTKTRAASVKNKHRSPPQELDSVYILKLMLYVVAGLQWLRLGHGGFILPLPVGLVIGLLFASHEHFRIDRKIEYAVLLISALVGLWLHSGVFMVY
jgi:hypothetical protein